MFDQIGSARSEQKPVFPPQEKPSGIALFSVLKRNGTSVAFDGTKIANAMTKAFIAIEGEQAQSSARIREAVQLITRDIQLRLERRFPSGGNVDIEDIQDLVELGLMRQGFQKVARAYVLYREEHKQKRQTEIPNQEAETQNLTINIATQSGDKKPLDVQALNQLIAWASHDLNDVSEGKLQQLAQSVLYEGIQEKDVSTALVMSVRPLIEFEPNYSKVSARLLLNALWGEANFGLHLTETPYTKYAPENYAEVFQKTIDVCVEHQLLSKKLRDFDITRLARAIQPERDLQFSYLGLQTLYDRYLLHWQDTRLETPQTFFMRVAMGLAVNEDNKNERAIEFYHLLSSFDYMTSTPTLFNSGTLRPQLSSCYLTTVGDDLDNIYDAIKENALLSKWAGGLGNDWTPVRALGSHIKGTNGKSQGVVPFLKVVNDTAVAVNQGGKRKGAVCAYLESWHLDIEEFLELRKNTGDERRRTHDMNSANWIPDLFMKRIFEDKEWTLFSPDDVADLHDLYGTKFEAKYEEYEEKIKSGEITLYKKIPASQLWRKMLSMLFETGHPWVTFKDPCNIRSPQSHSGVVHSSNLCTEITLNTNESEIAVCNLGSINLVNHIHNGQLDQKHLKRTIQIAVRMLDNVIDINYYAVEKARNSNLKHRPIGLGLMGFQDALYAMKIPYASVDAVHFADQSMELVSYYAIQASSLLAQERGKYESYEGSLWSQNILPIDSIEILQQQRGEEYLTQDSSHKLNWQEVRELIQQHGMRNSNVLAIAPTATISNIVGVSQSIEPTYQNLFVKSNLSGEFTVINPWLVEELKQLDLWDEVMRSDLKYFDGALQKIERIPENIKALFATAFEIDSRWLVEAASRRQKWIDQAQSLNLYIAEPSGKQLDNLYKLAWSRGLKTTYYLRSLGATHVEKNVERTEEQTESTSQETQPKMCSILDPDCEACQ